MDWAEDTNNWVINPATGAIEVHAYKHAHVHAHEHAHEHAHAHIHMHLSINIHAYMQCTRTSISTSLKQIHQESPVYPDQGVPAPLGTNKVSYHNNDTIFTNHNQVCCFKCGQWLDTRMRSAQILSRAGFSVDRMRTEEDWRRKEEFADVTLVYEGCMQRESR